MLAMDPEANHGRNSPLRDLLKHPVDVVVEALDKLGITADQITVTGLLGNILATSIVARDNLKPREDRLPWFTSTLILLLPKILDLLDGSLARKQGTNNPNLDAASDRISETIAGLAIMGSNSKARLSALASTLTAPLPSLSRAWAESQGKVVPESAIGSYPVRVMTTTTALVFPKIATPVLSAQSLASTITTIERIDCKTDIKLDPESANKSHDRLKLLVGLTALSVIAGLGLNSYLNKSK